MIILDPFESVAARLTDLNISFEVIEHPPASTTAEADSFIAGIDGVRTKSMLLTNKKKTAYYLLIMDDQKRLDLNLLKEITGESRVKLASPDLLRKKMHLPPGAVSIFGLLSNSERDIQIFFEREITKEPRMSFHPNTNTKTIFLATKDVFNFLTVNGFSYQIIDIS